MIYIQKVTGIDDDNMESGVVFGTGLIGVCIDITIWKVRTVRNKRWRPIDSILTNARKLLGVKPYERLYEERTWNICVKW